MNLICDFLIHKRADSARGQRYLHATLTSLREQFKAVTISFFLKATIRENVRLGSNAATDAELRGLQVGLIHDVIVDTSENAAGYNTIVDVHVPSGGQKRLIA
jgi:ABC-type multidrug transport system fused ATPase/permease subunit